MRDLISLPKVDLHMHFQGSVRIDTVKELAARQDLELPPGLDGDRYRWNDFFDFLSQYSLVSRTITEAADYHRVAVEICEDLSAQGVYAEVTLTVTGHGIAHDDWDTPVTAALDGFEEGSDRFGTTCRLVLDHVRGFPIDYARQTLDVALRHRDRGIVALGLGGPEAQSGAPVAEVFDRALSEGLHSVPHAGEAAGPDSIREALDLLGAERLGHGIRVLEDPELAIEVAERQIALEVCPSSNVATKVVDTIDAHPLPRLIDAGLVVTLNSDDPTMFDSPLLGEYEVARQAFGMDDETLAELARAGVRASFADAALKDELETQIDGWLKEDV